MNNWIFWVFILGAIISPFIYAAPAIRNLILGWRIPTTWISALPNKGWVEVVGKVRGETIKSLVNKLDCLFWQIEVQEYHGGKGGGWRSVHKDSSGPFELDDMTGRLNIQAGKSDFVLNDESVITKLGDPEKTLLEGLGIKTKGLLGFDKKLRIYERLITEGEEILVLGKFQKSEGLISGGSVTPLVISNLSKGEMLKAYFWRTARPRILPFLFSFAFLIYIIYIMGR